MSLHFLVHTRLPSPSHLKLFFEGPLSFPESSSYPSHTTILPLCRVWMIQYWQHEDGSQLLSLNNTLTMQ